MNNAEMQKNLYRILRMNIILAKSSGEIVTEDTLQSFDDAAKKIDDDNNLKYEKATKDLYYTTTTLEEEEKRLEKLISLIDERLEERKTLLADYKETTNRELEALGYIKDEEKIDEYKERLVNIKNYLSNKESILKIEDELKLLHNELDICYNNKQLDENNNYELEESLLNTFKKIVSNSEYSDILKAVDVNFELEKLKPSMEEAQKTLNTFDSAFNNLKRAGIGFDSELEYSSYVDEARKSFYQVKEQEFLYRIYKVIIDSKNIYTELSEKRSELDKILEERLHLRVELGIVDADILNDLYTLIDKQKESILKQKENIDRITEIEDIIKYREKQLEELKEDNQKVEILSLLQEFGIIDVYETPEVNKIEDKEVDEEPIFEEETEEEVLIPNMVVEVIDPYEYLNLSFARSKADTVMRRVGKSLGYVQEAKKESLVTFDFDKPKEEKEVKADIQNSNNDIANNDIVSDVNKLTNANDNINTTVNTNTNINTNTDVNTDNSNLNVDNFNNNFGNTNSYDILNSLNSFKMSDEKPKMDFSEIEASSSNIDNDFWSVNDDVFPNIDSNKDYKINQNKDTFKLNSPLEFGGSNENRN